MEDVRALEDAPRTCPTVASAFAAAPGLAAADRRGGLVAWATAAASRKPAAHMEPDAAGVPVAGGADADVPEPVEEGAIEV